MKIRELEIKNFRCFEDETLEFPYGLVGILGPNGSGKSSVLEAIGWVLYGDSRTAKEAIRYDGAGESAECRVTLKLEMDGEPYEIQRSFTGKNLTPHGYVRNAEGTIVAESVSGVNEYVEEKLLKMAASSFFKSVFSRQKDVDALSKVNPEDRREMFSRMLDIDQIKQARKQAGRDGRDRRKWANAKKEDLRDIAQLEEELEQQQARLKEKTKQVEEKEGELESIVDDLEKMEQEHEQLEQKKDQHAELTKQRDTQRTRLKESEKQLKSSKEEREKLEAKQEKLKELESVEQRYQKLKERKEQLEQSRDRYHKKQNNKKRLQEQRSLREETSEKLEKVTGHLKDFEDLEEKLEAQEETVESITDELAEIREAIAARKQKIDSAQKQIKKLKKERSEVENIGADGECPVCTQKLGDDFDEVIAHFDQELKQKQNTVENINQELKKLEEEQESLEEKLEKEKMNLDDLNGQKTQFENLKSRAENFQENLQKQTAQIEALEQALEEIGDVDFDAEEYEGVVAELKELEESHRQYQRLKTETERLGEVEATIEKLKKEIEQSKEKVERLEEKIEDLDFDEKAFEQSKNRLKNQRKAKDELQKKTSKLKQKKTQLTEKVEQSKQRIDEEKEKRAAIERLFEQHRHLSRVEDYLEEFRQDLLNRIRPALAGRTSSLLDRTTDGLYSECEIDEDYGVRVKDAGEWHDLTRFSGGETDLVNLCLRVAVSELVARRAGREIKVIILDEIFGSQDEQRRTKILRALKNLDDLFDQIFLITHSENVKNRLENVMLTTRNEGQGSTIEVI